MKDISDFISACKSFKKEAIEVLGTEQSIYENEEFHGLFDVVLITATNNEFEAAKIILEKAKEIQFNKNDSTIYYSGEIRSSHKTFKILLPFPYSMGIEAASSLTTKVISLFRPKYIFMVGICAGNKNVTKIGDVIFVEKSLNYHSVVEIERKNKSHDKKFMHNISSINGHLKSQLELFSNSSHFSNIKKSYPHKTEIKNKLKSHIGLMVTGSSLVRSKTIIEEINTTYHGVKGLDMETYGVYYASTQVFKDYAPSFISIKSVSDYGDNSKHELTSTSRKKYALHTSTEAAKLFIANYLE